MKRTQTWKKIPKYLILISLNDFYSVLCLHFCFLIEKITKGKKPPVARRSTCLWVDLFWINTENACRRGYLFWCILRAIYIETSSSTLEKKCCLIRNLTYNLEWNAMKNVCELVRLEYMQIFPAGRSTSRSGCEGRGGVGRVLYDLLDRSVLCDPRIFSLYHSMLCCNFAPLAILDVCLCDMCAKKKLTKKTCTLWVKCDLAWYKPGLF